MRAPRIHRLALALAAWSLAATADPVPTLSVELSLSALPEKPDVYEAVAVVSDPDSGDFLAAPFLRLSRGETAVTSTAAKPGGLISLSIGPVIRRARANWLVVWRRDGEIVARASGVATIPPDD